MHFNTIAIVGSWLVASCKAQSGPALSGLDWTRVDGAYNVTLRGKAYGQIPKFTAYCSGSVKSGDEAECTVDYTQHGSNTIQVWSDMTIPQNKHPVINARLYWENRITCEDYIGSYTVAERITPATKVVADSFKIANMEADFAC